MSSLPQLPSGQRFLTPSTDPRAALQKLAMEHQPPIKRMYRPGFDDLMNEMPHIDATQADQRAQVAATTAVLAKMHERVMKNLDKLNIPTIGEGQFGRIILAVEEPRQVGQELIPGTEVVLALWGKGFSSPVHGHAPGFIYEHLLVGGFDVHLYDRVGHSDNREARYVRTISQREPGVFYTEFVQDKGDAPRSALVHNFRAAEFTISMHYLPEHVRDSSANGFRVINTPNSGKLPEYMKTLPHKPGLVVTSDDVTRVTGEQISATYRVGDVYLVRSQNVAFMGPHYVIITGGMVDKPHGRRPQDFAVLVPHDEITPLDGYNAYDPTQPLVALRLHDEARRAFYRHYDIDPKFRRR
jgi:hypothetical protein